jgi:hypothetical protein
MYDLWYYMSVGKLHFFRDLLSDLLLRVCDLMRCFCCPKCYTCIGVFEQISDFPYLRAVEGECSPEFVFLFSLCTVGFMLYLSI